MTGQKKDGQGTHAKAGFMHAPYTGKIGVYLHDGNLDTFYPRGRCPVAAAELKGVILKFEADEEMSNPVVLARWARMPRFCNSSERGIPVLSDL
jgi:hypothetical protein